MGICEDRELDRQLTDFLRPHHPHLAGFRLLKLQEDEEGMFLLSHHYRQRPDGLNESHRCRPACAYMARKFIFSPPHGITGFALSGNFAQ